MIIAYYPYSGEIFVKWILRECCEIEISDYPKISTVTFTTLYPDDVPPQDAILLVRHPQRILNIECVATKQSTISRHNSRYNLLKEITRDSDWSNYILTWWNKCQMIIWFERLLDDPLYWLGDVKRKFLPDLEIKYPERAPDFEKIEAKKQKPPDFLNIHPATMKRHAYPKEKGMNISSRAMLYQKHAEGMRKAGYID